MFYGVTGIFYGSGEYIQVSEYCRDAKRKRNIFTKSRLDKPIRLLELIQLAEEDDDKNVGSEAEYQKPTARWRAKHSDDIA